MRRKAIIVFALTTLITALVFGFSWCFSWFASRGDRQRRSGGPQHGGRDIVVFGLVAVAAIRSLTRSLRRDSGRDV